MSDWTESKSAKIAASIELSARQALEMPDLANRIPAGTRVYLPDLGTEPDMLVVPAARRLSDLGYIAVPHIAARRCTTRAHLDLRIAALTQEGGVRDLLIIGGGARKQEGDFSSSLEIMETGLLDRYGIAEIGIAGHPEGSPDFSSDVAFDVLGQKADYAKRTNARMRIVTQFGFDGAAFLNWAGDLERRGIDLPVHFGVAGPAKITTLIRYAMMCGVGNSIAFLRKRALSLTALASSHSPEDLVRTFEGFIHDHPGSNVGQIHVYAFGGAKSTSDWLKSRGTWGHPADRRTA